MLDEKKYREMFSQVRASEETFRRVMTMKNDQRNGYRGRMLPRLALAAALIMLMAITVAASETVQNWFVGFFADRDSGELSQEQVQYIEENAETILDSQTHNGWTVELRSAIHDGVCGYVLFHIEGPEDMDLSKWTDAEGNVRGQILFGNSAIPGSDNQEDLFFKYQEELKFGGWGYYPMEDGDGLYNTADLLVTLSPDMKRSTIDPFGSDALYHFSIENIVWFRKDIDYEDQLDSTKYAGQEFTQYTQEELRRIHLVDTLAEGVWEFDIIFSELDCATEYLELLAEPLKTMALVFGENYGDPATMEKQVTVSSVQLRHLSVTITCADGAPVADYCLGEGDKSSYPHLVLKDGTEIMMISSASNGSGVVSMKLQQPIVFEEVAYIRMPDGTIISMPE